MPSRQAELLQRHREEILALAARSGILNVRVFGSVARGEETADSDIDLLVSYSEQCDWSAFLTFWEEVEELVGTKVDLLTEFALSHHRKPVPAEARPL